MRALRKDVEHETHTTNISNRYKELPMHWEISADRERAENKIKTPECQSGLFHVYFH